MGQALAKSKTQANDSKQFSVFHYSTKKPGTAAFKCKAKPINDSHLSLLIVNMSAQRFY